MTTPIEALTYISNARWNENADLDDICTMADRALSQLTASPDREKVARGRDDLLAILNGYLSVEVRGPNGEWQEIVGAEDAADAILRLVATIAPDEAAYTLDQVISISYTNWRGETSMRHIVPKSVRFGATEWHPEPQWLLLAWDADKRADREFALKDFGAPDEVAIRADEREKCAKLIEPKRPRPCDCERCDCHNQGDAEAVAVWDAVSAAAAALRSQEAGR